MPNLQVGSAHTSQIHNRAADTIQPKNSEEGHLGRFKVGEHKGLLSQLKGFLSKFLPNTTSIKSRAAQKTEIPNQLSRPTGSTSGALESLKNQPGASDSFRSLDQVLMKIDSLKADMNTHRRNSPARREAAIEIKLAQDELRQAVEAFNSKAGSAGLEPLQAYDLESAMANRHMDGSEDHAKFQEYQAIKNALS